MANLAAPLEGVPGHFVRLVLVSDTACHLCVVVVQIADGQSSY